MEFEKNDMNKPGLFILGAAKAGTTTVYHQLQQHPQIFFPYDKEPMFFSRDDYYERGTDWYLKTFFYNSKEFMIRGEASPHYLYWAEKVSGRIRSACQQGSVKFITILRNPIERAYSWYWNMVADVREDLSFMNALQHEEQRLDENWAQLKYYGSMQYGYFRGGCYATQIRQFLSDFPRENFLFLLHEDLVNEQAVTLKTIFRFLDVDTEIVVSPAKSNPAGLPHSQRIQTLIRNKSPLKALIKPLLPGPLRHRVKKMALQFNKKSFQYPEMNHDTRIYLQKKFENEIAATSDIISRDLSHWR
jgi:hypothetical protein